jgi:hypothetical protein
MLEVRDEVSQFMHRRVGQRTPEQDVVGEEAASIPFPADRIRLSTNPHFAMSANPNIACTILAEDRATTDLTGGTLRIEIDVKVSATVDCRAYPQNHTSFTY